MGRRLVPFKLHDWHNENDSKARFPIGGSGIPRADLRTFLPESKEEWERMWSTPPNDALGDLKSQLGNLYGFDAGEILITNGASEADFLVPLALTRPGERVVVEQPTYFALLEPARALGCGVVRVKRKIADGFSLPVDAVQGALRRGAGLVMLARPNNPTGARVPDEDLKRIAEAARRRRTLVLVDEVFAEATDEGDGAARSLHDAILSVNSITKCLGFGPLHVGWVAGPPAIVERIHRAKEHVRPLNPVLGLALAARLLPHRTKILEQTRRRRRGNAMTLRRFFASQPRIRGEVPAQGTTMVAKLPNRYKDDVAFAKRLLGSHGVLVAPGSYVEMPGWIRIGLLSDPDALKAGLEGLARIL